MTKRTSPTARWNETRENSRRRILALRRVVRALNALADVAYALDAEADQAKYDGFLEEEVILFSFTSGKGSQ